MRFDSYDREKLIRSTAHDDGDVLIGLEQEGGSGGKESTESTVRRLLGFNIRIDVPRGDKETRADPFSVQVNAGNVYLVPGEWNADYVDEMKYFPFASPRTRLTLRRGRSPCSPCRRPGWGDSF